MIGTQLLRGEDVGGGGGGQDVTARRQADLSGVMAAFHFLTGVLVTCPLVFVKLLKPYT